jgi:hypothetical protein
VHDFHGAILNMFNGLSTFITTFFVVVSSLNVLGIDVIDVDVERGRAQYEMVRLDTKMPRYGDCWKSALEDLHNGP